MPSELSPSIRCAKNGPYLVEALEQFTDLATRTDGDGGIVTVKAGFSGGRSLFFDGVIDENQQTMLDWLSLDIQDTALSQEPAIFVR